MEAPVPAWLVAAATLTIASVFDIRSRRIPNWLTGGAAVGGLVGAFYLGALQCAVLAALLSMLSISSPNLIRFGAIGAGDIKLAGAIGTLLGAASTLLAVGAAAFLASVYVITTGRLRPGRDTQSSLPLAPFLLFGFLHSFCAAVLTN